MILTRCHSESCVKRNFAKREQRGDNTGISCPFHQNLQFHQGGNYACLGVDLEGNKEVLALQACAEESKEGWLALLQELRTRGATQIDLIVDFRTRWLVGCAHRTLLSHPSPTLSRA